MVAEAGAGYCTSDGNVDLSGATHAEDAAVAAAVSRVLVLLQKYRNVVTSMMLEVFAMLDYRYRYFHQWIVDIDRIYGWVASSFRTRTFAIKCEAREMHDLSVHRSSSIVRRSKSHSVRFTVMVIYRVSRVVWLKNYSECVAADFACSFEINQSWVVRGAVSCLTCRCIVAVHSS